MLKDKRIRWAIGIIVVLIVAWIFYGITKNAVPVRISKASIGEIRPIVSVSGDIKGTTASLSSKLIGSISWIGVKEGDKVKKGDVLAKLDTFDTAQRGYISTKDLFESGLSSKNELETAKQKYESSCFIAPISGIVTLVANKIGESLSPGTPFIAIVDPMSAYGEVQIDESDIGEIRQGQEVEISADAYPNRKFFGKLSNIVQEAELKKVGGRVKIDEEDKIFRATVNIDDSSYDLKIGMTISADIILEKRPGLLTVPREAVMSKDGSQEVFVIKNNQAKQRFVELGIKDPSNIEVKNGLKDGETVAVTNLDKLKNNSLVKIEK